MKKLIFKIVMFSLLFSFSSCQMESDYLDKINEKLESDRVSEEQEEPIQIYGHDVTLKITNAGEGSISLSWEEPTVPDFDHVKIIYSPLEIAVDVIHKGTTSILSSGLTADTRYTITIEAISTSNELIDSDSITITLPETSTVINCISTTAELTAINDHPDNLAGHYILIKDLDLSNFTTGEGWTPIGSTTTNFSGIFDGNDHTISNLYINRVASDTQGFFGKVSGTINNLMLKDVNVSGNDDIAGLVGTYVSNYYNEISNCSVSGVINGSEGVGSIGGRTYVSNILNCNSSASVNGMTTVGGLIGEIFDGIIQGCYSTGTVTGYGNIIGGLIGHSDVGMASTIQNCYAVGATTGSQYVGGLIGYNEGYVYYCYSTGAVSVSLDGGGLIGVFSGILTDSYYDEGTSTMSDDIGKGKPISTEYMKDSTTFSTWDFTNIWSISPGINDGYPYLTDRAP